MGNTFWLCRKENRKKKLVKKSIQFFNKHFQIQLNEFSAFVVCKMCQLFLREIRNHCNKAFFSSL